MVITVSAIRYRYDALHTNVVSQIDYKEWCDQIINALHITTGWPPDGPYVEYPLKPVLTQLLLEEGHSGIHSRNINVNLERKREEITSS